MLELLVTVSAVVALIYAVVHLDQGRADRALASASAMAAALVVLLLLRTARSPRPAVAAATVYAAAMTLGLLAAGSFPFSDFVWTLVVPPLIAYAGGLSLARWLLPLYLTGAVAIVLWPGLPHHETWARLELTERFIGLLCLVSAMAYIYERTRGRTQARLQGEVDERRAAQAELAAANRRLEEAAGESARLAREAEAANEAKTNFLSQMSHDIRTPLTGVIGMVGLLEGTELDARQRRYVETIQVSGRALAELIGDILDMARIEAGQIELQPRPIELRGFLDEVRQVLSSQAEEKGLRLTAELAPGLPERLVADPVRLREILLNLGCNALKFTEEGEVALRFGPGADEAPGWWQLQVRDTGVGIAFESQERIFEAFHQADVDVARKHGGTGLGLAICKHLVELMGGSIGVESAPGRGATFTVRLPLLSVDEREEIPGALADGIPALAPLRILIVDDSEIVRRVLSAQLRRSGHGVEAVPDGEGALERLAHRSFDVVLMDVQLPGIDGIEATRRLRRGEGGIRNPETPVVGVTALADDVTRRRCLDAGMAVVVTKPVESGALLCAVAQALDET